MKTKSIVLFVEGMLFLAVVTGQTVGVDTPSPKTTLDVVGRNVKKTALTFFINPISV